MPFARALAVTAVTVAFAAAPVTSPSLVVAPTQTLQIGTNGSPSGPTKVVYICDDDVHICGPQVAAAGRWTQSVTVTEGTMVWIQTENLNPDPAGAQPDCFINDQSGQTLASGRNACLYQAAPRPPAPAPASG